MAVNTIVKLQFLSFTNIIG